MISVLCDNRSWLQVAADLCEQQERVHDYGNVTRTLQGKTFLKTAFGRRKHGESSGMDALTGRAAKTVDEKTRMASFLLMFVPKGN